MKRRIQITVILAIIFMVGVCNVHAAIDWDIYGGSETISAGDDYRIVSVYDDGPDHAYLEVTGGTVSSILSYENFNLKRNISSCAKRPQRVSDSSNISSVDYLTTSQLCQAAIG